MKTSPFIKVEVWSDVVCPFCYMGKRQWEVAVESFDHRDQLQIEWKSFLLDASFQPRRGESVPAALARQKRIPLDASLQMHEQLTSAAREWGLDYRFDTMISVNSLAAHRLIQAAKSVNRGGEAAEKMFHAYFSESRDIGDEQTLADIGRTLDLAPDLIRDAWVDPQGTWAARVNDEANEAHLLGARGVPFFVFDRQYSLSGAQGPARFLQVLEKVFREKSID